MVSVVRAVALFDDTLLQHKRQTKGWGLFLNAIRLCIPPLRPCPRGPDQRTANAGSQGPGKLRHPAALPARNVKRSDRLRRPPVRTPFTIPG